MATDFRTLDPLNPPDVIYINPKKDDIVRWTPDPNSIGYAYIKVTKIKEIINEALKESRNGN